jgi:hypothetical protein
LEVITPRPQALAQDNAPLVPRLAPSKPRFFDAR